MKTENDIVHIVILDTSGIYCRIYDDIRCTFNKFTELQKQYHDNPNYKVIFLDK